MKPLIAMATWLVSVFVEAGIEKRDTARLTHGRSLVMNMERLLSVRIKNPRRCAAPGSQEKVRSLLVELKRAQGAGLGLRPSRPAASGSRA